jgi:hypothetical protein
MLFAVTLDIRGSVTQRPLYSPGEIPSDTLESDAGCPAVPAWPLCRRNNFFSLTEIEPRFPEYPARSAVIVPTELSWLPCHFLFFFSYGSTAPRGPRPPHCSRLHDHTVDNPHSVGLLWTRDQPVAETSTWQHTTLTRDRRDSNPQSQQVSGRRPTP